MSSSLHPFPAEKTRVIHLRGTDRQIGRQHAEAVGPPVTQGMPKLYYDFWKRILEMKPQGLLEGAIQRTARLLIDPILVGRLQSKIPDLAENRIRGIVDVTGIPYEEMICAVILPDLLPLLQALLVRFQPGTFIPPSVPRFGCTSFVAQGKNFFHGRNLDFPGVSYWDRYPVIQAMERKNSLRYIGFTTAGVPLAGITGINEEKISVSLHQHYCREFSLNGKLPFVTAEEVLGTARSLPDALRIIQSSRVATSWAFVVVDGKNKTGFVCECQPDVCGVRYLSPDGVLAHSNYFQTPECRSGEYATSARMNWDNYWRRERLETLVSEAGKSLDIETAVKMVSDHFDPFFGEEKIINRTVSQLYNIQSLVFDYDEMKVLMAEGNSPIHLREYREYDLGEIFAGRNGSTGRTVPGFRFSNPAKAKAKEAYVLSFVAAFDGNLDLAFQVGRQALELDFCPEVAQVMSVVGLKLGQLPLALEWLQRAKTLLEETVAKQPQGKLPPEYFEIVIFLGRALDLSGNRSQAMALYREVGGHPDLEDNHLRQIALRARKFDSKALSRILMPYSSYIPFE